MREKGTEKTADSEKKICFQEANENCAHTAMIKNSLYDEEITSVREDFKVEIQELRIDTLGQQKW